MTAADWVLDVALASVLPLLAFRVVATDDLAKAVVLLLALGFLSAVAWGRLAAPDVALVEAAVGAGLTGALLMSALGWAGAAPPSRVARLPRAALSFLLAALAVGLGLVALAIPAHGGLSGEVQAGLARTGVSHPVTAVLLDFRGYDTLLEIAVLLAAAVAIGPRPREPRAAAPALDHPLVAVLVRMLVPGIVLLAGYLLWRGSHAPGGAFQAGAILGGAAILLILTGNVRPPDPSSPWVRAGLLAGPAVFLAIAAAPLAAGGRLLEYPTGWAGPLILAVEASLTLSIAVVLTTFFAGTARLERAAEAAA